MGTRIRIVFGVFALAMLGVIAWRASTGLWLPAQSAMLGVSLTCSLLVFVRFLYVFNYAYALSAMLNSVLIVLLEPSPAGWLAATLSFAFGLRLLLFAWSRERSVSYAPRMAEIRQRETTIPVAARIPLWLMPGLLYGFHLMAVLFIARSGAITAGILLGAVIMLTGILVEGIADHQKHQAKEQAPDRPVTAGLYRRWRHPNYSGEILFQLGLIVAGFAAVDAWFDTVTVLLAPLYIIVLMCFEAFRLDREQRERYGNDPDWQRWYRNSGSLLPFGRG